MNATITKLTKGFLTAALIGGLSAFALAQEAGKPKPMASPTPWPASPPMPGRGATPPPPQRTMGTGTYERSIAVTPDVKLLFPCVSEGTMRVNGWDRNEVRVFIKNGSKFNFDVRDSRDGKAGLLDINGYDPKKPNATGVCIWGERVEVDVPEGTTLDLKGKIVRANVDSIKHAHVKVVDGFIAVRNLTKGAMIEAGSGNIQVDDSQGPLSLHSTGGNIIAYDVKPAELGDLFHAKTYSGNITLESLAHRQVDVSSISGTIVYAGEVRSGGSYTMTTQNGSIRTTLSPTVSCTLNIVYAFGNFHSEFQLKSLPEEVNTGPIKKGNFSIGKGGPLLKLTTTNGNIYIKKAPAATAP
jgi:hypothetical protein